MDHGLPKGCRSCGSMIDYRRKRSRANENWPTFWQVIGYWTKIFPSSAEWCHLDGKILADYFRIFCLHFLFRSTVLLPHSNCVVPSLIGPRSARKFCAKCVAQITKKRKDQFGSSTILREIDPRESRPVCIHIESRLIQFPLVA